MRETILDLRNTMREMPWFAAVVALSVAIGVGLNASVIDEADGDQVRVSASRLAPDTTASNEAKSRMLEHRCSGEKIPGFTVVVALRRYSVELSVPLRGVRPLFDDARASLQGALDVVDLRRAA